MSGVTGFVQHDLWIRGRSGWMDGFTRILRQGEPAHILQPFHQALHACRIGRKRWCSQPCRSRAAGARLVFEQPHQGPLVLSLQSGSSSALAGRPAPARVWPMRSTMVSKVRNGLPRPFCVMWRNNRCSILFHFRSRPPLADRTFLALRRKLRRPVPAFRPPPRSAVPCADLRPGCEASGRSDGSAGRRATGPGDGPLTPLGSRRRRPPPDPSTPGRRWPPRDSSNRHRRHARS